MTELIPTRNKAFQTSHVANIPFLSLRHNFLKKHILDPSLRNSVSYNVFKINILNFIRPSPNNAFQCHTPRRIELAIRLRLFLSHFQEHKFKHRSQGTLNPLCSCDLNIETTSCYCLLCPLFHAERLLS